MAKRSSKDYRNLISPDDTVLIVVNHDPQSSGQRPDKNKKDVSFQSVTALARLAEAFQVPVIVASVAVESEPSRRAYELQGLVPNAQIFQSANLNPWENEDFRNSVERTGRRRVLVAGQEAEAAMTVTALAGLEEGFDVYVVRDSSTDSLERLTEIAFERMTQAGAVPVTWQQVALEWQRDWSKAETLQAVAEIFEGVRSRNGHHNT
jgi:nicotinamidase-related amidase